MDHTHDPAVTSWVDSANLPGDFPVQNLPFTVFRRAGGTEAWRGGVGIGDQILDLAAVAAAGGLGEPAAEALSAACGPTLNPLMALGRRHWRGLRHALFDALTLGGDTRRLGGALLAQAAAEHALPAAIGDFTDFYASIHHASAVGAMLRPDSPLLANYKFVPVGYHGRSSSVVVSPHPVVRPAGQALRGAAVAPVMGPTQRLDYELELGLFIGPGNRLGEVIPVDEAEAHVFGACLLNDWSARDIQAWEYQPLGPFLAKNFATTVSPWVVTLEALAPFRCAFERPAGDPAPLPHLALADPGAAMLDITLEASLQTAEMRALGLGPAVLGRSNARHAYWSVSQMVAHHASNGCNLRPGDLLGTGTLSGPEPAQAGSILELTQGGRVALELPGGERRRFVEDGDRVVMRGWCEREGARRIGFGICDGVIHPAALPARPPR